MDSDKQNARDLLFYLKNDDRLTSEERQRLRRLEIWLNELIVVESMYYNALRRQESDRPRNELGKKLLPVLMTLLKSWRVTDANTTIAASLEWATRYLEISGEDKTFPPPPEKAE